MNIFTKVTVKSRSYDNFIWFKRYKSKKLFCGIMRYRLRRTGFVITTLCCMEGKRWEDRKSCTLMQEDGSMNCA